MPKRREKMGMNFPAASHSTAVFASSFHSPGK